MDKKSVTLVKMGSEKPDFIYNQVWEVTCMTWPTPMPEKIDKSLVKIIRAS